MYSTKWKIKNEEKRETKTCKLPMLATAPLPSAIIMFQVCCFLSNFFFALFLLVFFHFHQFSQNQLNFPHFFSNIQRIRPLDITGTHLSFFILTITICLAEILCWAFWLNWALVNNIVFVDKAENNEFYVLVLFF